MISRAAVVGVLVVAAAAPSLLERWGVAILAAGFLLGLPHGAVDHVLPLRHQWIRGRLALAVVLAAYVGAAALTLAGLLLAGAVALPLLLGVSVLHFGAADRAEHAGLLGALAHGAPILAGPLLVWPGTVAEVFGSLGWQHLPSRAVLLAVGCSLVAFSVVGAARDWRRGERWQALDVGLLLALFCGIPPLAAFGVYFGAWHGLRHTARLLVDDPANRDDLDCGRLLRPTLRLGRTAAVPTLAALLGTAALVWVAAGDRDLVAPVFAVLLALTVPHVLVVARWDHESRSGTQHLR